MSEAPTPTAPGREAQAVRIPLRFKSSPPRDRRHHGAGTTKGKAMAKDKTKGKSKDKTPAEDEFGDPVERSSFKLADHEGAVLLITPRSLEEGIETAYGESDAIKADIVVLTKTNGKPLGEPEVHEGALIFQRVVIGQLESAIGKRMVVGKVGRGVAKKGQSAPFLIEKATDDEKALARSYRASVDPLA